MTLYLIVVSKAGEILVLTVRAVKGCLINATSPL